MKLPVSRNLLQKLSPFDRTVLVIVAILLLLIGVVFARGNQSPLRVSQFSWRNSNIDAQTEFISLQLDHPINPSEIKPQVDLKPSLAGTEIWQNRRWFYTLTESPAYGTNYQATLTLPTLTPKGGETDFTSLITSRARSFVYIGVDEAERGRLVLYDITNPKNPQKIILTPNDLSVRQFQIYPQGDRLVFLATDATRNNGQQQLFTVTTGVNNQNTLKETLPGRLQRLLENQPYNNQTLALSRNGEMLVLARQNQQNPADASLWAFPAEGEPRPLGIRSNAFVVSPQGDRLATVQDNGVTVIPLQTGEGGSKLFNGFKQAFTFSPNNQQLLLGKQNLDFTYSASIINLQTGEAQEFLRDQYPIKTCQFDPRAADTVYCLQTDYVPQPDGTVREEPYLALINLNSLDSLPLLALPNYPEVDLSLAPDGLALMFDQVATTDPVTLTDPQTLSGRAISDARVWLLPLPEEFAQFQAESNFTFSPQPQELTPGFAPQWMP